MRRCSGALMYCTQLWQRQASMIGLLCGAGLDLNCARYCSRSTWLPSAVLCSCSKNPVTGKSYNLVPSTFEFRPGACYLGNDPLPRQLSGGATKRLKLAPASGKAGTLWSLLPLFKLARGVWSGQPCCFLTKRVSLVAAEKEEHVPWDSGSIQAVADSPRPGIWGFL